MLSLPRLLLLCSLSFLLACSPQENVQTDQGPMPAVQPGSEELGSGLERDNMNTAIAPGDDFYRYVNGNWLEDTAIPADRSNYGAFTVLADEAETDLRSIIEEAAAEDAAIGSDAQKVGDFYTSFMNQDVIERLGINPLQETLAQLDAVSNRQDMLEVMTALNYIGVQMPFSFYINVDERQTDQYIAYVFQSGLGLPDRDWYLQDDETYLEARQAYSAYIEEVMTLAGFNNGAVVADAVMQIENRIAQAQWDRVQNRQRELTYNKLSLDDLQQLSPALDWSAAMQGLGMFSDEYIIQQPDYFSALSTIWSEVALAQWQHYSRFKLVNAYADYLSQDFVDAKFTFEGGVLSGLEENRPRWKRGIDAVDSALGEMLGKLYVERYFQEEAKARMDELIENLRGAFNEGIDDLDWMTAQTKLEAQDKLARFTAKIGYPEEWKDYSGLEVSANDLVGNVMRSRRLEHNREVSKLGQPIDRGEWYMTPYTVNAYYNPSMNEVVFPAAILQPPFFNVSADDAVNYGGIGAVIGHEFSHGFDDQGRKSDGDGMLRDWWTEADAEAFAERSGALVEQFNQFEVLPGRFLNGEFTLGENIGDLSGLEVAYRAYRLSLNGEEAPVIDGFTGDQRFFMGWAQVWRRLYRDENLEVRITSDPHSHSEARTNGIVRNIDAWYEAFNIQPDAALYLAPDERVKIW
ncbi:MAG: peptidase M13 [Gammaproteobacteria bacterium]|nr:peptidase M13 [Gammaproteobacteria bacterium]MAY02832.1 peptidase M13 [Gammaproteobacteria bacterium]|tara:strand:- start:502411 stop:504480 length:2070 start_codon:yes stop_codon:yes gene_type:complete